MTFYMSHGTFSRYASGRALFAINCREVNALRHSKVACHPKVTVLSESMGEFRIAHHVRTKKPKGHFIYISGDWNGKKFDNFFTCCKAASEYLALMPAALDCKTNVCLIKKMNDVTYIVPPHNARDARRYASGCVNPKEAMTIFPYIGPIT